MDDGIATVTTTLPTTSPLVVTTISTHTSPLWSPPPKAQPWATDDAYTLPLRTLTRGVAVAMHEALTQWATASACALAPSLTPRAVTHMVHWLCREGQLDPGGLVPAVHYLQQFVKRSVAHRRRCRIAEWAYAVVAALLVASKVWDDEPVTNASFAELLWMYSGETVAYQTVLNDVHRWERAVVQRLLYTLHITPAQHAELWQTVAAASVLPATGPASSRPTAGSYGDATEARGASPPPHTTSPTSVASAEAVSQPAPTTAPQPAPPPSPLRVDRAHKPTAPPEARLFRQMCADTVRQWFASVQT